MKALFGVALFVAVSAFAQDPSAITTAVSACGPMETKFEAKQDPSQHPNPQPEADKALVFVVQDIGMIKCSGCALTKVGLDGAWVGANQGSSYVFFFAEPGEHHVCLNWQSWISVKSRAYAFANFTAEAGKTYYLRASIFATRYDYSFDLDPINSDEGKYLVASSAFSVSHPKK